MRVIFTAFALCALSFLVGVAGDLSTQPANAGQTVTLRIPPPIPADAPRARPLVATSTALAAEPRRAERAADLAGGPVRRDEKAETPHWLPAAESVRREVKPRAAQLLMATAAKGEEPVFAKTQERKQV